MKQVLMDWGNSRLKWKIHGGEVHAVSAEDAWPANWQTEMAKAHVYLSSVRSAEATRKLRDHLLDIGVVQVTLAAPERCWQGLENGYLDVAQMGGDRWLAMIAAWSEARVPWMVVDAGTAVTVDWIDGQGRHLGGHIVPGVRAQVATLGQSTAKAKTSSGCSVMETVASLAPGRTTKEAIWRGAVSMLSAYLEMRWLRFLRQYPNARCLIGGGDGPLLAREMGDATVDPHLVLSGLEARFLATKNGKGRPC